MEQDPKKSLDKLHAVEKAQKQVVRQWAGSVDTPDGVSEGTQGLATSKKRVSKPINQRQMYNTSRAATHEGSYSESKQSTSSASNSTDTALYTLKKIVQKSGGQLDENTTKVRRGGKWTCTFVFGDYVAGGEHATKKGARQAAVALMLAVLDK